MRKLLLGVTMCLPFLSGFVQAEDCSSPKTAAEKFFQWYVDELNADDLPEGHTIGLLEKRLDPPLFQRYKNLLNETEDGMDEDYFLKTQDIYPIWSKNPAANIEVESGNYAVVSVGMAMTTPHPHSVVAILHETGGCWKIAGVYRDGEIEAARNTMVNTIDTKARG